MSRFRTPPWPGGALRPRNYKSAAMYNVPLLVRCGSAPSKLPKCHYSSCPLHGMAGFCAIEITKCHYVLSRPPGQVELRALEVTKVSLFIVFPTQIAPSKLSQCSYLSCSLPVLRPRSCQMSRFILFPSCVAPSGYQSVAIYRVPPRRSPSE